MLLRLFSWVWSTLPTKTSERHPAITHNAPSSNGIECPYEYILNIYGRNHFKQIVQLLDPSLETRDAVGFAMIMEIMDAIHLGLILVDDIADNSTLRKGHKAAHMIYGPVETSNRAYTVIFQVIEKCSRVKPSFLPFVLDNIMQIHQGQDLSLVWRRDGFDLTLSKTKALDEYQECASQKTGALFRLIGQLVSGTHEKDDTMSSFGWYCQLQNDCKNVFSSDVVVAKGALAEDLANGEYSYPILVALYSGASISTVVKQALDERGAPGWQKIVDKAIILLQEKEVKDQCLQELERLKVQNMAFASLWGREEKMSVS